jgi:tryptophanyl-tRNA synthetase
VYVLDEPDVIRRKFRRAVADSGREIGRREDKPGISNLIEIMAVARGTGPEAVEREFDGSGYGDFKTAVADAVVDWLAPVRERYEELRGDPAELERILAAGADKARAIASGTLADVREAMGVGPPRRSVPPGA